MGVRAHSDYLFGIISTVVDIAPLAVILSLSSPSFDSNFEQLSKSFIYFLLIE